MKMLDTLETAARVKCEKWMWDCLNTVDLTITQQPNNTQKIDALLDQIKQQIALSLEMQCK